MMRLRDDETLFKELIKNTADYMGLDPKNGLAMVEKDYYVTLFLKHIAEQQPDIVFKGGTSLSKCYKIINRFSEDADFGILPKENKKTSIKKVTEGQRKKLKNNIMDIAENKLGLIVANRDDTRSKRDFNKYIIKYPKLHENAFLDPNLVIETSVQGAPFPTSPMEAGNLIYNYLKASGGDSVINDYDLGLFMINTQSYIRTFIDKVFAIADYYSKGIVEGYSRHIYDICKICPLIEFDDDFRSLIRNVREARKKDIKHCVSAQDGFDLQGTLRKIIDENYYKEDYAILTDSFLYDNVFYDEAIAAVQEIVDSGFFDFAN
jgi:hypothetical protein